MTMRICSPSTLSPPPPPPTARRLLPILVIAILAATISMIMKKRRLFATSDDIRRPPQPFADRFPTLDETLHMAHLSRLVYKFRYDLTNTNCSSFNQQQPKPASFENVECHWYHHDTNIGTQVLIVSNDVQRYVAVIFAGTDDLRTSLEDANVLTMPFGNNDTIYLPNKPDMNKRQQSSIRVHAGFNHAVFMDNIWERVYTRTKALLETNPSYNLWTAGHSLGASNSVMTAAAFATLGYKCRSVNFGCPQTGNYWWKEFFRNDTSPLKDTLGIWRVVLAWDLVARLPELFYHVGHTIQLDGSNTSQVRVYYEHYGLEGVYSGVPFGWSSKSYAFLPWALGYHHISKYVDHLEQLKSLNMNQSNNIWPDYFLPSSDPPTDDDYYDPPDFDDYIVAEYDYNYNDDSDTVDTDETSQVRTTYLSR